MVGGCRRTVFPSRRLLLLLAWLLGVLLGSAPTWALTPAADEAAWLADHPVVQVLSDGGSPPFDFLDEQGRHAGLVADYLREISQRTGLQFVRSPLARRDRLVDALSDGGASLLVAYGIEPAAGSALLPVRRELARDYPVLVRRQADSRFAGERDTLRRFSQVRAYAPAERYLQRRPAQVLPAEGFEPALVDVALGRADGSVLGLAVGDYLIRQRGLAGLQLSAAAGETALPVQWWVAPGDAPLRSLLERTWDVVPAERHRQLRERWLGATVPPPETSWRSALVLLLAGLLLAGGALLAWPRVRPKLGWRRDSDLARLQERMVEQGPGMLLEMEARDGQAPQLLFVSREARRVFGIEAAAALPSFEAFLRSVLPEDQASIHDLVEQTRDSQLPGEVEYRLSAPDGLRWMKTILHPRREADGRAAWSGVTVEMTAQKLAEAQLERAERRLREITDNVPGVVYQYERDAEGRYRINFASAAMVALRGLNPEQARADGEEMFRTMHEDDRERIRSVVERSAQTLEPYDVEYRVRMPDGRIEWMHGNANPVRLPSGTVVWNGFTNNVTRIKQTEQRLEETERFLREITDHIPGWVFQLRQDPDGGGRRLSYISAGIAQHGLKAEEVLASPGLLYSHSPPEDQQRILDAVARSAQTMQPFRIDYPVRLPNGQTSWLRSQAAPRRLVDGSLVWNGVTHNVSEEKLLEIEAQRVRQQLQDITDALPGVVYQRVETASGESRYSYISNAVRELFEVSPEQLSRDPAIVADRILSEDTQRMRVAFEAARLDHSIVSLDFRIQRRDGQWRWMRTLARPQYDAAGDQLIWNGFSQDVSAERAAQERADTLQRRLMEITANVPCVVFQLQRDFEGALRLLFVSDSLYALTGIARDQAEDDAEALLGLILPEERVAVMAALDQTQQQQRPVFIDFRFRGTDGLVRWVRSSLSVPRRDDGGLIWSGTWQDITDIKELQQQLDEAKQSAESASRLKSEFLANMSHEIRTPMNAIIGLGQLVLQTGLSGRQRDYVGKMLSAGQSLLAIINDILDLSKIEAGKMTLESTEFDLGQVLDNLSGLVNLRAAEKGLELCYDLPPNLPLRLVGDPLRLGQVLVNLLGNAIKFSEAGDIRLRIRALEHRDSELRLRIEVIDQGIGLSGEQLKLLFESFAQGDASTTRKYGGTGLGLSISRNLVRLMGGEIDVQSQPGQGSCFAFEARFGVQAVAQPRHELPADLGGLRALIADDRAMSREVLASWLAAFGFAVDQVADGESALERLTAAEASAYSLVFLDWQMPGLGGLETARRIRQMNRPRLPALVLTSAFGADEMMRLAEDVGVRDFLAKPASPSGLFHTVLVALGRADVEQANERTEPPMPLLGRQLLVADDDPISLQVARELLETAGAVVTLASSGRQVLERAAQASFDAILLDVQMPEMDGLETVRRLRAEPRHRELPVIAMTAHAMAEDRRLSLQAGMSEHLAKPIDRTSLIACLQRLWSPPGLPGAQQAPAAAELRSPMPAEASLPVLDADGARARLGGNSELYARLLARFQSDHREAAGAIAEALAAGDLELAKREAHSLKGVAANLGAQQLSAIAASIEQQLRAGVAPPPASLDILRVAQTEALRAMQQAAAPAPSGVEPTADSGDLALRLRRLASLLADHDAEAKGQFAALTADLGRAPSGSYLRLRLAIDSYDTDAALVALRELALELNLEIGLAAEGV